MKPSQSRCSSCQPDAADIDREGLHDELMRLAQTADWLHFRRPEQALEVLLVDRDGYRRRRLRDAADMEGHTSIVDFVDALPPASEEYAKRGPWCPKCGGAARVDDDGGECLEDDCDLAAFPPGQAI